jgi:nucleoside phosphorylase
MEYGLVSAANVARDVVHSFPNVKIGLMVGIGGGVPTNHDIRLGDVVVSSPGKGLGGVLQHDFGKTIQNRKFEVTWFLNQPLTVLRTALSTLKARHKGDGHELEEAINKVLQQKPRMRKKYQRPDESADILYKTEFVHPSGTSEKCGISCGNDPSILKSRVKRSEDDDNPMIHYGLIASANQVMKDAGHRDELAGEKDVLCFEMEAAGLMNNFPCLVVRGMCDYSDSHKNKAWKGYAAMAAAAYTVDLLHQIHPVQMKAEKNIAELLEEGHRVPGRYLLRTSR